MVSPRRSSCETMIGKSMLAKLLVMLMTCLFTGCGVILPLPHTSPHGYDFRGQIVDARTHRSLPGAKVQVEGCPSRAIVTGADGHFAVSSGSYWYLFYYVNPSFSVGMPEIGEFRKVLLVEKAGYQKRRVDFNNEPGASQFRQGQEVDDLPDRRLNRTTLVLNPIPLLPVRKP